MGNSDKGKTYRATDWKEVERKAFGGAVNLCF